MGYDAFLVLCFTVLANPSIPEDCRELTWDTPFPTLDACERFVDQGKRNVIDQSRMFGHELTLLNSDCKVVGEEEKA